MTGIQKGPLPKYWAELFNRVEEMEITKGGKPINSGGRWPEGDDLNEIIIP
jgi:hypothetical protein